MRELAALVLAAGHGKRMRSTLTKVLHPIAGKAMVHYPIQAALGAGVQELVLVVGPHNEDALREHVERFYPDQPVTTALQREARGTGDAATAGMGAVSKSATWVMILCGDTPLVRTADLQQMIDRADADPGPDLWVMTCRLDDPTGYGRVLRDDAGRVTGIREQRDLREGEEKIRDVNSGIYLIRRALLEPALAALTVDNAQGEYYLTDVVRAAARAGGARSVTCAAEAALGVNDPQQLADLERRLLARVAGD